MTNPKINLYFQIFHSHNLCVLFIQHLHRIWNSCADLIGTAYIKYPELEPLARAWPIPSHSCNDLSTSWFKLDCQQRDPSQGVEISWWVHRKLSLIASLRISLSLEHCSSRCAVDSNLFQMFQIFWNIWVFESSSKFPVVKGK